MKKRILWLVLAAVLVALAGCGGEDRPLFREVIPSTVTLDGEIVDVGGIRTLTFADTVTGIYAGVDPATDDVYRSFLHFPLTTIPGDALISSATLSIVVKSVDLLPPASTIPIVVELVSFGPPLEAAYFNLPAVVATSITPPISINDATHRIDIPVTSLMVEAQRQGLNNFQVRLRQENDFAITAGLMQIDESSVTNEPRLIVFYF
ncbi:DNRLRE domain-containing protein [Geomonas subterranea]|uniref:DNRLRE domain-containing protein n=1 Tax=Geomonas subterranea TaxID=2847989 RepID=UPI001CD472D3|nr:DNRLRE domain-containing protein [Geomonas fuzhouensis]